MIIIGLGANLPSPVYGSPIETLRAALFELSKDSDITVDCLSKWYESAPVPMSDAPWYVNACAAISTELSAIALLERLLKVEAAFGRIRSEVNAPRIIDLDIIAYHDEIHLGGGPDLRKPLAIPHPRLKERSFVVLPIKDIAPAWKHPESGETIDDLAKSLPTDQIIRVIDLSVEDTGTKA